MVSCHSAGIQGQLKRRPIYVCQHCMHLFRGQLDLSGRAPVPPMYTIPNCAVTRYPPTVQTAVRPLSTTSVSFYNVYICFYNLFRCMC